MSFVGLTEVNIVGVGDRLLNYWAGSLVALAGFSLRVCKGTSPGVPVARVFVTFSRPGNSLQLDAGQPDSMVDFIFSRNKLEK